VYLCVGHTGELCKNGWTDRDAVWGADSYEPKVPSLDGLRSQREGAIFNFWGLTGPLNITDSLCCGVCSKESFNLNNGMTARLLQPTAMLLTIRCHITLSPWKIRSCNAFLFYYSVPSTVLAKVTNLNGAQFYFITNKNRLQKYSGSPVVSLLPPGLPSRIIARTVSSELLGFCF